MKELGINIYNGIACFNTGRMKRLSVSLLKGIVLALFFAVLLYPLASQAAETKGAGKAANSSASSGSSCNHSCAQVEKNQADGGCKIAVGKGNKLEGDSSTKLDSSCIKRNSSNGCFNAMPVSAGTGNYTMAGWRSWGDRNHYGTDIGASGYTNSKVFAATDGKVVHAAWNNGSGRTLAILHDKKCTGASNNHYLTIYRHLWRVASTKNPTEGGGYSADPSAAFALGNVKKDDIIGIVGGSNVKSGKHCDNPDQDGGKSCRSGGYYALHLHFEMWDGDAVNGTQASSSRVMQPSCASASVLCGGCAGEKCGTRSGNPIAFGSSSDSSGVIHGDESGSVASNCSFGSYLDSDKCSFCGLFKTMFNVASQVALMADKGLMEPTLNLVKIGFLIWLAIYLLKQIASFSATNSGEMAKGILFQGFRVAVVVLILNSTASLFYVMDLTLNPVMMTGMNFIGDLGGTSTCDLKADYMSGIKGYSSEKGYADTANIDGGLSKEVGESIICSIKHMEDSTSLLMKLGNYSVCLSFERKWLSNLLPHLGLLTTGVFLWLAGLALLISFPWCLVDCVLQLCIAAALIPCAIGAFAFKITSKYLKIVWDFFMNAMFSFVFMAIIVYIINQQLQSWLGIQFDGSTDPDESMFLQFSKLAWYGMGFIRVFAICFFCYVFFEEAKDMANKFASSAGLGGSKGIGRMIGGTMGGIAADAGLRGLKLGGRVASAAGDGVNAVAGNKFRSMRNNAIGALASRLGKNGAVTVADGKTVGREGSIRMFGRDIKFSATKGDDGKWTLTRESHKRSATDKAFEKVLDKDGNEVRDANGNVKYRARHRVLGVFGERYEDMIATKDEDGNLVYSTADGKSKFRMNDDGEIVSYQTRFTRSYLGLGKSVEKGNVKQYGTNRTVSTATSRTREVTDSKGNVVSAETEMKDFSFFNRDLVRKDGTINIDTFNEMQKNMKNPEAAAKVLIAKVMEKRGMKLDLKDPKMSVDIDDNGRVTIQQTVKDKDGNVTEIKNIQAVMVGDQMFIAAETTDKNGNITLNESNGIFHTVQTAVKQKDGSFKYDFDGGFSEHAMSENGFMSPVNYKGEWGNNIDRDKAMAGFSNDHFEKYMDKLRMRQMERTMSTGEYNRSEAVNQMYSHIHGRDIKSLEEAMQNMAGTQGRKNRYGTEVFSIKNLEDRLSDRKEKADELDSEIKNQLNDIKDVRDELDKEYIRQDKLLEEQKQLLEAADRDDEEIMRLSREIQMIAEETEKRTKELEIMNKEKREKEMQLQLVQDEINQLERQKGEFYTAQASDDANK